MDTLFDFLDNFSRWLIHLNFLNSFGTFFVYVLIGIVLFAIFGIPILLAAYVVFDLIRGGVQTAKEIYQTKHSPKNYPFAGVFRFLQRISLPFMQKPLSWVRPLFCPPDNI